jgi:chemotaxis protein MotB
MVQRRRDITGDQNWNRGVWMITFSDIIMLLLTFFVMLLSMSSMDTKRLKQILRHMKDAPGVFFFSQSKSVGDLGNFIRAFGGSESKFVIDQDLLKEILIPSIESEKKLSKIKDPHEFMDISDDERGIVLSFQEDILFDLGKATIKEDAFPVLDSIAKAIFSSPNDILIMGHTDSLPIKSQFYASNWELSSQRGLSVLEYFLKKRGLSPSRFSVGGYGPSRPRYPNDTAKNRALNRRVEIIFKHL